MLKLLNPRHPLHVISRPCLMLWNAKFNTCANIDGSKLLSYCYNSTWICIYFGVLNTNCNLIIKYNSTEIVHCVHSFCPHRKKKSNGIKFHANHFSSFRIFGSGFATYKQPTAVWPDGQIICSKFCHLQQCENLPNSIKIAKEVSKFCEILNKPSKLAKGFFKFYQSGNISPNLVTLSPTVKL